MNDPDRATSRKSAIEAMLSDIRPILDAAMDVDALDAAKSRLIDLCARRDLFTFEDFPIPEGETERTYLIHQDTDGRYALYVNAGRPGQSYRPHDHCGNWAIVAAVHGEETHRLFEKDESRSPPIEHKATLTVRPGHAVSMLPEGIHAISAEGTEPLLHLHLYGLSFEFQRGRSEYDEDSGEVVFFDIPDIGAIIDAR